ncbi:MAG: hypothetical protein ACPGJS_06320 [Flammeovirgaceae bacterium]
MNKLLKKVLIEIDFVNRYNALREKHAHNNVFQNPIPKEIQKVIEACGYTSTFYPDKVSYGDFEIHDNTHPNIKVGFSPYAGVIEFTLAFIVKNKNHGGPFAYLSKELKPVEFLPPPRFASYAELKEVLIEGFSIYEEIRDRLVPLLKKK